MKRLLVRRYKVVDILIAIILVSISWQYGLAQKAPITTPVSVKAQGLFTSKSHLPSSLHRKKSANVALIRKLDANGSSRVGINRRPFATPIKATNRFYGTRIAQTPAKSLARGTVENASSPDLAVLKAQRHTQRVDSIKRFLEGHNITHAAMQEVIVDQITEQEAARRTLQEAGRQLFPTLGRKGAPPLSDAKATAQIEAYQAAIEAYQTKRRQSAQTLEEKLNYSKTPRLRALLLVLGLIGDGLPVLSL